LETKITNRGQFERIVEVDISEAELQPHFEKALLKFRKNIKLEGFRKGKVPLALVKKMYGDAIKADALDDVVGSVLADVGRKEDLRPVAPAKIADINYDPKKGLQFKATIEVVPEIELKSYTGLSVEKESYQVDEQDVVEALADVRERMAVMQSVDAAAEENHFIVGDFQLVDNTGVPIIGRKYEDRFLHLNRENDFNISLTEQLVGIKAGEKRRVEILPANGAPEDKEPESYEITVKEVKSKQLPELDDELAKDAGDFENLAALQENIRTNLRQSADQNARQQLRHRLIDAILKKNSFELPEAMIDNYLDAVVENARKSSRPVEDEAELRQQYRATAIWSLKWELVKNKLVEQESLTVTTEEKDKFMQGVAEERGVDLKEVKKAYKGQREQRRLEDDLLEEKVLDLLEQHAKIKERKVTRKDLEKAQRLQA
jgi:trigger factor